MDLGSYVIVQVRRMGLRDLSRRHDPLPIHIHVRDPEKIPSAALTFYRVAGSLFRIAVSLPPKVKFNIWLDLRDNSMSSVFPMDGLIPLSEDLSASFLLGNQRVMAIHSFVCDDLKKLVTQCHILPRRHFRVYDGLHAQEATVIAVHDEHCREDRNLI